MSAFRIENATAAEWDLMNVRRILVEREDSWEGNRIRVTLTQTDGSNYIGRGDTFAEATANLLRMMAFKEGK